MSEAVVGELENNMRRPTMGRGSGDYFAASKDLTNLQYRSYIRCLFEAATVKWYFLPFCLAKTPRTMSTKASFSPFDIYTVNVFTLISSSGIQSIFLQSHQSEHHLITFR